jgi:hypothetical protein
VVWIAVILSLFLLHRFCIVIVLKNLVIYLFKSDKGQLTATNISQRLKLNKSSFKNEN